MDAVKNVIARGVNIDQGDYDGRTSLHLAVAEHKPDVVNLLLGKGCKWNVVDTWGTSPLLEALQNDELVIAQSLCDQGAQLSNTTVQFLLEAADNEDKLRLLCTRAGVDIDMADANGKTALHYACALRLWRSCQNLLSLGANANIKDKYAAHVNLQLLLHHSYWDCLLDSVRAILPRNGMGAAGWLKSANVHICLCFQCFHVHAICTPGTCGFVCTDIAVSASMQSTS